MRQALIFLLLLVFWLHAEDDFEIDERKDRPKGEATAAQLEEAIKQLSGALPANTAFEHTKLAEELVSQARRTPDLFCRLMIPPNYPRAVSKATAQVRARSATVLGLTKDRRMLQQLLSSAVFDPDAAVRAAAAEALPKLEEPVALRKLIDLAVAADYQKYPWVVRQSACAAVRHYGDKAAVERLLRELSYELAGGSPLDTKNKLRGKSHGLGSDDPMMLPSAPPDLRLSEQDMYPVLSALKEITGKSFGSERDMKNWLLWWKKEKDNFTFKK